MQRVGGRGFESVVRYIAYPLSQEPCFLIAGQPESGSGVLIVRPKPPFERDPSPPKTVSG
jgi:hypothetical protein